MSTVLGKVCLIVQVHDVYEKHLKKLLQAKL